jgi:membrane-bound serine protease (ClpP class)
MPFAVALLCHPAGAYVALVTAIAGLLYAVATRSFLPGFTAVSAALLTLLAFLAVPPNVLGLLLLGLGVGLLHVEFLLPTFGAAGVLGLGVTAWASSQLLAPSAATALTDPSRSVVAVAGTLVLFAVVARTMRLWTLPRD